MAEDFYETLARMGVEIDYYWCTTCGARACDEGMTVCHPCAADKPNP